MIQFLNPVILWALPLALAPLLLRHRKPRDPVEVPFAAMRFLKLARPRPRHHRLLTAIRIALLTILILAFARPDLPSPRSQTSVAILPAGNPYLTAALGSYNTTGAHTLDFTSTGEIQSGNLTVAPGPYFHPALQIIPSLHQVHVRRWVKLPVEQRTIILLRLSNGDPFLTETAGQIQCAAALDPDWTDLPFHPNFLPLVTELTKYLQRPTPGPSFDITPYLLLLALVLALLELALAGFTRWKLPALLLVLLLLLHPVFRWPATRGNSTATIVDRTDSMAFQPTPASGDIILTGPTTDLGSALLALTNRPLARVILYTDGQHNTGPDPVWAAAQLGVPVVIPNPAPAPLDVSITSLTCPDVAVAGRLIDVTATITGPANQLLRVTLGHITTNIPPGTVTFQIPAAKLELQVAPIPGEVTDKNNRRPLPISIVDRPYRVFLQSAAPDWEYRHVRHALAQDPLVELVTDPKQADEIIATTNETWRLRRYGTAFTAYWQTRLGRARPPGAPSVSDEFYRLGPNEQLIRDIARVSGGVYEDVINSWPLQQESRLDLRNSWLVMLLLLAAFTAAWARQRMLH